MDIIVKTLEKDFLKHYINRFVEIVQSEKLEYWNEINFLMDIPGKYQYSLVAFSDDVYGFLIASKKNNIVHIHKFMVDPKYRNRGIGLLLQTRFEERVKNSGGKSISLHVMANNFDAIRFYKRHAYKEIDKKIDSINNCLLVRMEKEIK